jgi:Nitrile hydratase beta subunit, N-terminal
MGGEAAGPVDTAEHVNALWEKRVDALMMLLTNRKPPLLTVDQIRRAIESLPADAYDRMGYYERWIAALTKIMTEKGVLTEAEIEARVAAVRARGGKG